MRALCPIHGSDHQKSLSIDMDSGWGHCFNAACHAIVLVEEFNPEVAARLRKGTWCHPRPQNPLDPRPPSTAGLLQSEPAPVPSASRLSAGKAWQQAERVALLSLGSVMCQALLGFDLGDSWQAQAYLEARGIPLDLARAAGVGYLPPELLVRPELDAQRTLLQRWADRLIFPLTSPAGNGYIGRSLWRWQIGMDEGVHKAILEQEGTPRRWIKTNPAGWFCVPPVRLAKHIVLVEGGFDRLALLAGGFAPEEVVALVGVAADPEWFPAHIRAILLALDGDAGGRQASERLARQLAQQGRGIEQCPPPEDGAGKDWSERWRRSGTQGLEPLYAAFALLEHAVQDAQLSW